MSSIHQEDDTCNRMVASPESDPNALTIATSADGRDMRKVIGADALPPLPFELFYQTAVIEGIADLRDMLDELRSQPRRAVLRGEPLVHSEAPHRRLLTARSDDGVYYPATFQDVPRAWLMLDIDSIAEPDGVDFKREPARCAEYLRAQLPKPFHAAQCVWHASGSAGFKPGIRLHLWFLLDKPLTGDECKAWLSQASVQVDRAVFGAVHLHFTADSDLGGAEDPMSARIGQLTGDTERVDVPDILPELPRTPRKSGSPVNVEPGDMKPQPDDVPELPENSARCERLQADIEELWESLGNAADGRKDLANKLGFAVGQRTARNAWGAHAEPYAALDDTCGEWSCSVNALLESNEHNLTHSVDAYIGELCGGITDGMTLEWSHLHTRVREQSALERILERSRLRREQSTPANDTRTDAVETRPVRCFNLRGVAEIFAPLPPVTWTCAGLQLGPGRVNLFVGYGASGKTFAAQALGIAVASGTKVWGRFDVAAGRVVHLDFEQGEYATRKRYQRLVKGAKLEPTSLADRLVVDTFPSIYLTERDAHEALLDAARGARVVIIDSLRAACPGVDENDANIRAYLDLLTRVSEETGAAIIVIHHAGKGERSDVRHAARGSSAIFDAAGCVLNFEAGAERKVKVEQAKQPAASDGDRIQQLQLELRDVGLPGFPNAGINVVAVEAPTVLAVSAQKVGAEKSRVLDLLRKQPGMTQAALALALGGNKSRLLDLLELMVDDGTTYIVPGRGKAKKYFPAKT